VEREFQQMMTGAMQAANSSQEGRRKFLDDFMFTWGEKVISEDGTAVLSILDANKR